MESPQTSKKKINEGDDDPLPKVDCTPKHHKSVISGDEFSLYYLHRESSPNFRAGQDVLEVGWGDSPEPLNMEQKYEINQSCKKKLEIKESPKSSIPCKRRNVRSTFSLPSKSIIDVSKYVAEVQELSKNIMKEFNAQKSNESGKEKLECEKLTNRGLDSFRISESKPLENSYQFKDSGCSSLNNDPAFDSVLQTFINEEDDWLSQALSSQEVTKTPLKGNFVKSKSENELTLPPSLDFEKKSLTQNCRNFNNNFRRTSSFDMTKPQTNFVNSVNNVSENIKSFNNSNGSVSQYSLQEIERKRLEAKYRKERREIERKKLEALKKLEMKKLRVVKT